MNKINIFIGLIAVSAVNPVDISLKLIDLKTTSSNAPISAIGQYVSIKNLLTLICGLNNTASSIITHVIDPIFIAADINYLQKNCSILPHFNDNSSISGIEVNIFLIFV